MSLQCPGQFPAYVLYYSVLATIPAAADMHAPRANYVPSELSLCGYSSHVSVSGSHFSQSLSYISPTTVHRRMPVQSPGAPAVRCVTATCNSHSPADTSVRSGVTVMERPWPLAKSNGFIRVWESLTVILSQLRPPRSHVARGLVLN